MNMKFALVAALMLALGLTTVANARAANTYDVDGSMSPTRAGSKAKPTPVGVKFGFTVSAPDGQRPSPVKKYSIRFNGLAVNTNAFPKCSAATLESKGPKGCPAGSKMGSGFIENATGSTSNPMDQSVECN